MDASIILTIIGIVVAIIIGIWQIWLARKQVDISKPSTSDVPAPQGITESKSPSAQSDNQSIVVGRLEIDGIVNGNITIGNTFHTMADENITKEENRYRERPYPREIRENIDKLPPFQQDQMQSNYIGLKVRWQTTLSSVRISKENIVILSMLDRGSYPWIYCEVNILEYPELKIAREGYRLWVEGELASIRGNEFELENCKITLD